MSFVRSALTPLVVVATGLAATGCTSDADQAVELARSVCRENDKGRVFNKQVTATR